jgi:Phosphodiester glycosidase
MLAPTKPPALEAPPRSRPPIRGVRGRRSGPRRARRIALIAAVVLALPALVSYLNMLTQPSDSSLSIRTVEWMRDNGARGLVNQVENIYYSLNAPATGGPALRALPKQPAVVAAQARARATYHPPRIRPVIAPALPGEGVWRPTFSQSGTRPPVLVTQFRPEAQYPQNVAGVAWIDHTRTSVWLYPGRLEPSVAMASRGPMQIPPELRGRLVATFNSGFKLQDSGGGFASGGHTYAPLKNGLATILRYRNGQIDVRAWAGGPIAGPNIVYARQNLPLIVNNARLNPNLSDGPQWGVTLGNAIRVWRSGLGIDAHGNLIYAAANDMTVGFLAEVLRHAGAVRAMELDINTYWTSFITYRAPGAIGAANLLASMDRSPQRYLTPEDRDFFGVYVR